MAVIERHRSIFDHLTGRNAPAARSPHAPSIEVGAPTYRVGTPNLQKQAKASTAWLFLTALALIIAGTAAAGYILLASPNSRIPRISGISSALTTIAQFTSIAVVFGIVFTIRFLVQKAIWQSGAAIRRAAKTATTKNASTGTTSSVPTRDGGGKLIGSLVGIFVIVNFAIPAFHTMTRNLGIQAFPGAGFVPMAAIGLWIWYRHGRGLTAAAKPRKSG